MTTNSDAAAGVTAPPTMPLALTLRTLDQSIGATFGAYLLLDFTEHELDARGIYVETLISVETWEAAGMPTVLPAELINLTAVPAGAAS